MRMHRMFLGVLVVGVAAVGIVDRAAAQVSFEAKKILASTNVLADDEFGSSVSISGSRMAIGTSSDKAYVFERRANGQWEEVGFLTAGPTGSANDFFGRSVSISGNRLVVGAMWDDDNGDAAGSAYVFELIAGTWTRVQKLHASDGMPFDAFGFSVSISGDWAVVGALGDEIFSGSVYVFQRQTNGNWLQYDHLFASNSSRDGRFGDAVSISGNRLVVGAPSSSDLPNRSGSAYVFELDAAGVWREQIPILHAGDGLVDDRFGGSVSMHGDRLVVGSLFHEHDHANSNSGAAYVFERINDVWTQTCELLAGDPINNQQFSVSVAISADRVLVGAQQRGDAGLWSGSAYLFECTQQAGGGTWTQLAKLLASDGAPEDFLGGSVSLSEDWAVLGASRDDDLGDQTGSVYAYCISEHWTDLGCDLPGTEGSPLLSGFNPLLAGCNVTLSLTNARSNAVAWLVVGLSAINRPFQDGILKPNPDFFVPLLTSFSGEIHLPFTIPSAIVPGITTIYAQYWIQDPGVVPQGWAASNAVFQTAP